MENRENAKDRIVSEALNEKKKREAGYREKALKMFPHVCGKCGREFSGKRVRELTVHHRDHNHDNNPPDGSNWELLCIYCHDNEHSRQKVADAYADGYSRAEQETSKLDNKPFAALAKLMQNKK